MNINNTISNDEDYIYMPSTTQQVIISSLQIPPSILSLIGSSLIIVNVRKIRKRTPYRRILLALSMSDIVSTVGWLLQPFLADKEAPGAWLWSVGNNASCVMLGSFSQFGVTSHLYSLFLSVYFLFIVRFGMKERTFAKFERWIHAIILVFSISTAIAGVLLGIFRPSILSPGCWISAPPEGCSEDCPEAKWAWLFGGLPTILTLVGISISNSMLYLHVRRTVWQGQMKAMANEKSLSSFQEQASSFINLKKGDYSGEHKGDVSAQQVASDTYCGAVPPSKDKDNNHTEKRSVLRSSDKQWKRVQEVGKQGFLYVGAYLLSFLWTLAINFLDSQDYEYRKGSENYLFPLLILQALFSPALGFSNAVIFFRPKMKAARTKYPDEPLCWVFQQVVTGAADARTRTTSRPSSTAIKNRTTSGSSKSNKKRPRSSGVRINFAGERLSSSRLSTGSSGGLRKWSSRMAIKSSSMQMISEDLHESASDDQAPVSQSAVPNKEVLLSSNDFDDEMTENDTTSGSHHFEVNCDMHKQETDQEDTM